MTLDELMENRAELAQGAGQPSSDPARANVQSSRAKDTSVQHLSPRLLVARSGSEVVALARLTLEIEAALPLQMAGHSASVDGFHRLQDLDRIRQSLEDLGHLLLRAAEFLSDAPSEPLTAAVSTLRLADLKQALSDGSIRRSGREPGEVNWL